MADTHPFLLLLQRTGFRDLGVDDLPKAGLVTDRVTAQPESRTDLRGRLGPPLEDGPFRVGRRLDQVTAHFGRLDGLINNAGIVRDGLLVKVKDGQVVGKMTLAQWQAVIDVNLTGVFLCAREAAQRMIQRAVGGVIVNLSSISRAGNVGQTNYTAAKAGVAAMTVVWAKELARYGIRVGAVAPGFIRTPMVESMKPEALAKMTSPIPLGRLGEPQEIAHAVGFIFENELFTGRCLEVDAGLRM